MTSRSQSSESAELARLRSYLRAQEQVLLADLPSPRGWALIELSRAIDLFLLISPRTATQERRTLAAFYGHGWPKTLSHFVDDASRGLGIPLRPSSERALRWASGVIQSCGRIALCESILEQHRTGLVTFKGSDESQFRFAYAEGAIGLERVEVGDWNWVEQMMFEGQEEDRKPLDSERAEIRRQMKSLVAPWMQRYIQYDTTPEIDMHFHREGMLRAERMTGYDAFATSDIFGGLPFELYRNTVGTLIGFMLKHLTFCDLLMKKHPEVSAPNVVTIPADRPRLVEALALASGESGESMNRTISTTTLGPHNLHEHVRPNSPPPLLIQLGDDRVLKSVTGHFSNPFQFMLRELRTRFPRDWDQAVDDREGRFRFQLYALFSVWPDLVVRTKPVVIRSQGRVVTDIDAVLYDRRRRVLGLVQLKWQDPFASLRERNSRKENFVSAGNGWVEDVLAWLGQGSRAAAAIQCGIGAPEAERVERIALFVLGRNFAHFSGTAELHDAAAWGNWAQVVRLVHRMEAGSSDPIGSLYDSLRRDSSFRRANRPTSQERIELGEISVVVDP